MTDFYYPEFSHLYYDLAHEWVGNDKITAKNFSRVVGCVGSYDLNPDDATEALAIKLGFPTLKLNEGSRNRYRNLYADILMACSEAFIEEQDIKKLKHLYSDLIDIQRVTDEMRVMKSTSFHYELNKKLAPHLMAASKHFYGTLESTEGLLSIIEDLNRRKENAFHAQLVEFLVFEHYSPSELNRGFLAEIGTKDTMRYAYIQKIHALLNAFELNGILRYMPVVIEEYKTKVSQQEWLIDEIINIFIHIKEHSEALLTEVLLSKMITGKDKSSVNKTPVCTYVFIGEFINKIIKSPTLQNHVIQKAWELQHNIIAHVEKKLNADDMNYRPYIGLLDIICENHTLEKMISDKDKVLDDLLLFSNNVKLKIFFSNTPGEAYDAGEGSLNKDMVDKHWQVIFDGKSIPISHIVEHYHFILSIKTGSAKAAVIDYLISQDKIIYIDEFENFLWLKNKVKSKAQSNYFNHNSMLPYLNQYLALEGTEKDLALLLLNEPYLAKRIDRSLYSNVDWEKLLSAITTQKQMKTLMVIAGITPIDMLTKISKANDSLRRYVVSLIG